MNDSTLRSDAEGEPPRNRGRSALALLAGFVLVFVLSLGTDQLFHVLNVYPAWREPMYDFGLNLLALSYRVVYAIAGSYVAARLAPRFPMRHAMYLGYIGLVLSTLGAIGAIVMKAGAIWYPIALVLTTLPCAWLGGVLQRMRYGRRAERSMAPAV
jgi:hypothetical protein